MPPISFSNLFAVELEVTPIDLRQREGRRYCLLLHKAITPFLGKKIRLTTPRRIIEHGWQILSSWEDTPLLLRFLHRRHEMILLDVSLIVLIWYSVQRKRRANTVVSIFTHKRTTFDDTVSLPQMSKMIRRRKWLRKIPWNMGTRDSAMDVLLLDCMAFMTSHFTIKCRKSAFLDHFRWNWEK